jgi:serine/threonine protein kinase
MFDFADLQMCVGVAQAHSICHRDLKPENLLLDDKLNIKIGTACLCWSLQRLVFAGV